MRSRSFSIARGVKQGDPISALLFIAVMQDLCGQLKCIWAAANGRRKGTGIGIDFDSGVLGGCLTSLSFADDVVLVARTKNDIRKMLNDFAAQALRYGLKINFDKTKVLTCDHLASGCDSLQVGQSTVEILRETESEKYLGRKLCFNHHQDVELDHRIAAACSSFHKHKAELCSKHYALEGRLKLLEAVVTPIAPYGCAAWALTCRIGKTLKTARRKMLR